MKKFFLIAILISNFSLGQIFDLNDSEKNSSYFESENSGLNSYEDPNSTNEEYGFQTNPGNQPDQGVDGPGPGGPGGMTPIDNWLFLLPLAGLGIGFYFLQKKRKKAIQ